MFNIEVKPQARVRKMKEMKEELASSSSRRLMR